MKKFITIFFAFLFISLYFNTINTFATPNSKTLTQGIYSARDTNLLIGVPITAKIKSANSSALIIVVDSNQNVHTLVKLTPQIPQQILPPFDYNYSIIIFTKDSVILS